MCENPWQVENVQAFAFLNCPECTFKSKHEDFFQEHAEKSHPLSTALFDRKEVLVDPSWDQNDDFDNDFVEVKTEEEDSSKVNVVNVLTSTQDNNETLDDSNFQPPDTKAGIINKKDKKYTCYYCDKEFSRLKHLQGHRQDHIDENGNFPCRYCDKKKPKYEEISKHIYMIHWEHRSSGCKKPKKDKGKIWKCYYCKKTFLREKFLREHRKLTHTDEQGNFLCKFCDKKTVNYKLMGNHMREKHASPIRCIECDKAFSSQQVYNKHRQLAHPDESAKHCQYQCDQCSYTTHFKAYLSGHKGKVHKNQKENVCKDCNKAFIYKGLLQLHVCNTISEETKFKCPECDFSHTQGFFMKHFKKHHGGFPPGFEDAKIYICDQCPEEFLTPYNLANHKSSVHKYISQKFVCDKCDTGHDYRTARMLVKHYFRDHGAVPPMLENQEQFMCSHCPNIYTNKRSLTSHVKYKHSDTPSPIKATVQVQCPICKKDYSGQVALKNHIILKHERSAQHQCEICQGKYPTATKLRHHINMVHSKVTCDICGDNFSRTELRKHKSTMHGIGNVLSDKPLKPFKCPFCTNAFKSKRGLMKHSVLKHDTEIEVEMGSDIEIENEVQVQFIIDQND